MSTSGSGDIRVSYGCLGFDIVRPITLRVWIGPFGPKSYVITEGSSTTMDLNLGDNQFTTIHLQGLDAAQQAGTFRSPPQWTVDDPTVVTITPAPDGASCRVEAAVPAKLGPAVLTVTDVDDPNVPPLTFNITVMGEQPISLGATIDPPTERPAPTGGGTPPPTGGGGTPPPTGGGGTPPPTGP